MSDAAHDIFAEWTLPIWFTLSLILTAAIYLRGWLALRKTRPEQFTDIRLLSFLSGLAVLWIAVGSPMDGFADALLSAHMVEHLLLMSVVPPLLLYGLPVVPLLRGLPTPFTRTVIGPLLRLSLLRRFVHWLVTPAVAWLLMNLAYLGWHVPSAYDFALEHENWHVVEHLCFLGTSILFWYCILWPWPARAQQRNWGILIYLVGADLVNTMLSAFLAFCDRPVYRYYIDNPNPFHVSVLQDQVLGAAIMWVLGSLAYLGPVMIITFQLLARRPAIHRGHA
jgi:putative membrane protein